MFGQMERMEGRLAHMEFHIHGDPKPPDSPSNGLDNPALVNSYVP